MAKAYIYMIWPAEAITLKTSPPILPSILVAKLLNKTNSVLVED